MSAALTRAAMKMDRRPDFTSSSHNFAGLPIYFLSSSLVLDQRGQLLRAAVGFATLAMSSLGALPAHGGLT